MHPRDVKQYFSCSYCWLEGVFEIPHSYTEQPQNEMINVTVTWHE